MAAKGVEKIRGIVECPICLQTFTNPKMFQCLHFFCGSCINDLQPAFEKSRRGYNCPMCREFTPEDDVRKMPLLCEILEAVEQAEEDNKPCDKCPNEKALWRCSDCKENFCDPCRDNHNSYAILSGHSWHSLTADTHPVIDRHVFCSKHPGKLVELHCKDCSKLICLLCNGTDHKHHSAESIEEAIQEAVTVIKARQSQVQAIIQKTERSLSNAKSDTSEVKAGYKNLNAKVEESYKEALRKLKDDYETVKQHLAAAETKQVGEMDKYVKHLDMKLKSQKNLVQWSETTLTTAQGPFLLDTIQTGLKDSLDSCIRNEELDTATQSSLSPDASVVFEPSRVYLHNNTIGKIVPGAAMYSMKIPRPLTNVGKLPVTLVKETDFFQCPRFALVGQQLWCIKYESDLVHLYSIAGKEIKTLKLGDTGDCRSVQEARGGVVVAADKGLFLTSTDGESVHKLLDGSFSDVSVSASNIYALEYFKGLIVILRYSDTNKTYAKSSQIKIVDYRGDFWDTIQITEQFIFISSYAKHTIQQYNIQGEYVAKHGSYGSKVGQLHYPMICGADADGVLLVADIQNHRLQTLTPDGAWRCVTDEGLCQYPLCAVMTETRLLVTGQSKYQEFTF